MLSECDINSRVSSLPRKLLMHNNDGLSLWAIFLCFACSRGTVQFCLCNWFSVAHPGTDTHRRHFYEKPFGSNRIRQAQQRLVLLVCSPEADRYFCDTTQLLLIYSLGLWLWSLFVCAFRPIDKTSAFDSSASNTSDKSNLQLHCGFCWIGCQRKTLRHARPKRKLAQRKALGTAWTIDILRSQLKLIGCDCHVSTTLLSSLQSTRLWNVQWRELCRAQLLPFTWLCK